MFGHYSALVSKVVLVWEADLRTRRLDYIVTAQNCGGFTLQRQLMLVQLVGRLDSAISHP